MEKQPYSRQLLAWWESLETEADNSRINPIIFKESKSSYSDETSEKCFIIKESLQKLVQFLNASHQDGCTDKNCRYDPRTSEVKLKFKHIDSELKPKSREVKILKKRGRKSKYELQQMALLRASNGYNRK